MHIPPTILVAIIGVLGSIAVGFITFFSGRNASVAVLQTALTEGFRELNAMQTEKMNTMQSEIDLLRGQVRGLEQRNLSLRQVLRANGIDIPRDTIHVPVFTPYPDLPVAHPGDIFDPTCESDSNE